MFTVLAALMFRFFTLSGRSVQILKGHIKNNEFVGEQKHREKRGFHAKNTKNDG
jgi:hypothetical protein